MSFPTRGRGRGRGRGGGSDFNKRESFGGLKNAGGMSGGRPKGGEKSGGPVAMKSLTLDGDNTLTFFGQKHYLSTFYECQMTISGHTYPSVEHYYEACKVFALAGPYAAMALKDARDPKRVKMMAKSVLEEAGKDRREVNKWKTNDGLLVIRVGLMEKFRQNDKLRNQLFNTNDSLLVQTSQYDRLWACGQERPDFENWVRENMSSEIEYPALIEPHCVNQVPEIGNGKNLLGFMLMYVRDCLRAEFGMTAKPGKKVGNVGSEASG